MYGSFAYASTEYGGVEGAGISLGQYPIQIIVTPPASDSRDITPKVDWNSLRLTLVATKEVSTAQFSIVVQAGGVMPNNGDRVDVYELQDDNLTVTHIFGGKITDKELTVDGGIVARWQYTVTDGSFDFDSKVAVKTYTNMDPGAIARDLVTTYAPGFSTGHIANAGYTIPSIQFNYQPLTKCFQKLATLIGWDWYIDAANDVHFFSTESRPAPFSLDDTSGNLEWKTIDFDVSIQNLKNSVFVIGGSYSKTYTALTTPDVYTSVAATVIYPLAYSYDPLTLGVTLAGVAQTVGIDQKDNPAGFQVLYNAGQNGRGAFLRFTTDPGTGNAIKAFGAASIPVLGHAFDSASITSYGTREDTITDKLITTVAEAQQRAQAEIALYGQPNYGLKFRTLKKGLVVGQQITISSSLLGISQAFTVKRLTVQPKTPTQFEYSAECVATESVSFVDIMTLLLEQELNSNQVDPSTTLEVLITVLEAVTLADSAAITTSTGPYLYGSATWGFASWGP